MTTPPAPEPAAGPRSSEPLQERSGQDRPEPRRRDGNGQARLAMITALVALVSAIAGPLVSLKINSDQITTQRLLASAQTQQEELAFLRTERRTAYAELGAAFSRAYLGILASSGRLREPGLTETQARAEADAAADLLGGVTDGYFGVALVGTQETSNLADKLLQATTAMYSALIAQVAAYGGGNTTTDEAAAVLDAGNMAAGVSQEFIATARSDLEADRTGDEPVTTQGTR